MIDQVPADIVEREREVAREQSKASGESMLLRGFHDSPRFFVVFMTQHVDRARRMETENSACAMQCAMHHLASDPCVSCSSFLVHQASPPMWWRR